MEFPRFVFMDGGNISRAGGFYSQLLVSNQEGYDKAIGEGWFASIDAAVAGEPAKVLVSIDPVPEDDAPPTRAELESKAEELGLKFDGRIGDKKLLKLIEDAIRG